jgi:transcriptional regulator with XRE-family HTH domain
MKDRILAFLQNENKSYAQFAEEIGVQPSGISHILSGRNNPSLDFVTKMLHRYSSLSAEWLLFGKGPMYKHVSQPTLFDMKMENNGSQEGRDENAAVDWTEGQPAPEGPEMASEEVLMAGDQPGDPHKRLIRVLFFYADKTFTEYVPS